MRHPGSCPAGVKRGLSHVRRRLPGNWPAELCVPVLRMTVASAVRIGARYGQLARVTVTSASVQYYAGVPA